MAEVERKIYVSPYNDLAVVAGQGTVALEMEAQTAGFDTIMVATGGGGLIGGIAACLLIGWVAVDSYHREHTRLAELNDRLTRSLAEIRTLRAPASIC